jgi:predicted metal-binding membrane protein
MFTQAAEVLSPLERLIRRDRLIVGLGFAAILALSWAYLLDMAAAMGSAASEAEMHLAMGMTDMRTWGLRDFLALFLMWAVMMVAMMLPSAAPLTLLVLGTYRRRGDRAARLCSVWFVGGYLLAWTAFSLAAAGAQVLLHHSALLSPRMAAQTSFLAAGILVIAGLYQWLPLKNACLAHCRSPLDFLTRHWREGFSGALSMGVRHGLFCVGCCWALMALLFVAGVMNLLWVAAISAFVLIEKLAPHGPRLGRVAGLLLIAWGTYVLIRGFTGVSG